MTTIDHAEAARIARTAAADADDFARVVVQLHVNGQSAIADQFVDMRKLARAYLDLAKRNKGKP
jgi:sulfite reductase beta subunit-like hemoprotein